MTQYSMCLVHTLIIATSIQVEDDLGLYTRDKRTDPQLNSGRMRLLVFRTSERILLCYS